MTDDLLTAAEALLADPMMHGIGGRPIDNFRAAVAAEREHRTAAPACPQCEARGREPSVDVAADMQGARNALAFARSTIMSGEEWSQECRDMIGGAIDQLDHALAREVRR